MPLAVGDARSAGSGRARRPRPRPRRPRSVLDRVGDEPAGDVLRRTRIRRGEDADLHARAREHDRHRQREGRERVEVIELHRQVEGVRGHRPDERRRQPPGERPHAARRAGRPPRASARPRRRAERSRRKIQNRKSAEERRPDEPRLDEQRDVERVRPPVRPAGDELVVDREVVQPEPEQRMEREHVRDEAVDVEVRRARRAARLADGSAGRRRRSPPGAPRSRAGTTSTAPSGTSSARETSLRRYGTASTSIPTASPSRPLRDSVASSITSRKGEQEREPHPPAVARLEPQVDRASARAAGRAA